MIEQQILDYLTDHLSVPICMEVPSPLPETFVLLEKTGSSRADWISSATLALQSWAMTLLDAAKLNEQVKAAMDRMPDTEDVGRAELNTDYVYTDTATKRYRYQAVYDITY